MRVEPDLTDHPKYLRLKRRVGPDALEMLLRVWGHCQSSQKGGIWTGADGEYLELVARWPGEHGVFFAAMKEIRFVDETPDSIVIHDWNTFNSKAVAAWTNGQKGGHRTENFIDLTVGTPQTQVGFNPMGTVGNPLSQGVKGVKGVRNSTVKGVKDEGYNDSEGNPSSLNPSVETDLIGRLREILGKDEMARAGGHWRVDWVRKHPELVNRALLDLELQVREGRTFANRASYLEDLLKRWLAKK